MNKFSVIIPTYNRGYIITRAIESVIRQTYKNWELIIVDDGSIDNTDKVIEEFLEDNRIRYFKKNNSGAADSRNYGAKKAEGQYLTFLDSDDCWTLNKLELNDAYIQRQLSLKCYYSSFRFINSNTNEVGLSFITKEPENMLEELKISNPIGALPAVVIPRQIFFELGGFDVSFKSREDLDLYYRISKKYEFVFIPEILVNVYYKSEDRISANNSNRIAGFQTFLEKHGSEMSFSQRSLLAKRILIYAVKNKSFGVAFGKFPLSLFSFVASRFK